VLLVGFQPLSRATNLSAGVNCFAVNKKSPSKMLEDFTIIQVSHRLCGRSPDFRIFVPATFPSQGQWPLAVPPRLQWWDRSGLTPDSLFSAAAAPQTNY